MIHKSLYSFLLGGVMLLSACSDFTDVQPKGTNLLTTTTELEMLLNIEYNIRTIDEKIMSGDMIYGYENLATTLSKPNKGRGTILMTWDESRQDKMAELTSSDPEYNDMYGYIGKISNAILSKVDDAQGDEAMKRQLKCEALVVRAYFHWLLINKFAKAYNPASADNDPGLIYMTEGMDITQAQSPVTVQQFYENILADADQAIELDGLPEQAVNRMRMNKACAYAVKALALQSMQQWSAAEAVARQALAISGEIDNYNDMLNQTVYGNIFGGQYSALLRTRLKCAEDLFYTEELEFFNSVTFEGTARFEPGHVCNEKFANDRMTFDYVMGYGDMLLGIDFTFTYDLESGWNQAGIKTTYLYLLIAEAQIHAKQYDEAMKTLDKIRVNRINPEIYQPLEGTVSTESDAIFRLKQTAHGEGIYSCYNFINRKRWNQVVGWKETLSRDLGTATFTIAPDSPFWIFPIPLNAINNNPNLSQNYK